MHDTYSSIFLVIEIWLGLLRGRGGTKYMHSTNNLREGLTKKNCCSFGFCPNYLPPSPQFGHLVQFFSNVKIQNLKVSLGLKLLYIHDDILYIQPKKKQFKVQTIGILEEKDSYYWPKMHLWKCGKKIWQPPRPPSPHFGQYPKEQQLLFR